MEEPLNLTLLYTAGIRGDLALLPRLYTFLQRLKPPGDRACLLLDLGKACSDAIWHCRATGNRSALIVLDGMGYHAANIAGALEEADRAKLAENVQLGLVDHGRDWTYSLPIAGDDSDIITTLKPSPASAAKLQILLTPAKETRLEGNALSLAAVGAGQVGAVALEFGACVRLTSARIHDMPPNTPPNPSIAGAVDFVLGEARLFQAKGSSDRQ